MKKLSFLFLISFTFFINSQAQTGMINGYVYLADSSSVTINSGIVVAYKDTGAFGYLAFDTAILSAGSYSFSTLDTSNKLLLLVIPDSATYPNLVPTYADSSVMWHKARTYLLNSVVFNSALIDVYVKSVPPVLTGNATITGRMRDQTCNCTGKVQGPGDPFNGVDVSLIDKSTGSAIAMTVTDNDTTKWQGGNFIINNVPPGDYFLYCDLTGIIIDTNWSFTITGTEQRYFEVIVEDDHMWYIETSSVEDLQNNSIAFGVYPNPTSNLINISYTVEETENVIISLFDVLGRKSINLSTNQKSAGKYVEAIDISQLNLSSGTYFIKMKIGDKVSTRKLMIKN